MTELQEKVALVSNNIRIAARYPDFELSKTGFVTPGDLGLFRVLSSDGGYIEQLDLQGDEVRLRIGDRLVGVFGIRESGTNISGDIPRAGLFVKMNDRFQILSSSAIVGYVRRIPADIGNTAVDLALERILRCDNRTLNLRDGTPYQRSDSYEGKTPMILVVGSSGECGKTTVAGKIIADLGNNNGMRIVACKTNGSGNVRDKRALCRAGASFYLDHVDFGLATTYGVEPDEYRKILRNLLRGAEELGPDVIIVECGGDVMWGNVPTLLAQREVMNNVVAAVMCSTDYVAAYGAYEFLRVERVKVATFFNVPMLKESYYRKQYFESLVNSEVYDIMVAEERLKLTGKLAECVEKHQR